MSRAEKAALRTREWRKNHPGYMTKYMKEYGPSWREERKTLGLCARCPNQKLEGKTQCEKCLNRNRLSGRACIRTMKDILPEDHDSVKSALENPNKICECCGSKEYKGKGWHIDHCHVTKKFRGLLCQNCNLGLGHFKDDISLLKRAIEYLRRNNVR